jgi:hypothetical protein
MPGEVSCHQVPGSRPDQWAVNEQQPGSYVQFISAKPPALTEPNIRYGALTIRERFPGHATQIGGYLKPISEKPWWSGVLRRRHVADVRFPARLSTQKRQQQGDRRRSGG